jgi:NAD(P)-dependent dehydrogenase (short-subunit alcohol dehydrogenase family)
VGDNPEDDVSEPLDVFRLDGKVAVITGGSRGLGREMAFAFALVGADVIIASRKYDACANTADEIVAATGRRAVPVECHVGRWADCDRLFERAYEEFDRVDVLVNNAGGSPLYGDDLRDVSEQLWHKVVAVNAGGPFRLSALFGARMVEDGGGAIVNMSSVGGVRPGTRNLPYGASKAALHALTIGFSQAYGPTVRVNAIAAGAFKTDISKAWDMEVMERAARETYSLQRLAEPDEIVGTALYLASDASSFVTGTVMRVDGGYPA